MQHLYLTRHGETVWNLEQRLQGWKDSPLTEKGIRDAQLLQQRLQDVQFDAIYTSPSDRALTTAEIIRGKTHAPLIKKDELKELFFGEWEGKRQLDIDDHSKENYMNFWNHPSSYDHTPHHAESLYDFKHRIEGVLKNIIHTHQSGNVLVVAHAIVIKMILLWANKHATFDQLWEPPFIQGASLTILEVEDKDGHNVKIRQLGDTSHLE